MKLIHPDYKMQISLKEGDITELIIENPAAMFSYTNELIYQTEGGHGSFVLSDGLDILDISSLAEYIFTPYYIDINGKKILKKLYSILKNEILSTELIEDFTDISSRLSLFTEKLSSISPYNLSYDITNDPEDILKYLKVKISSEKGIPLAEQIIDFVKIISELFETKILILINMRSFIDDEFMEHICREISYRQMSIFLIESSEKNRLPRSKRIIIDRDMCEIYD